MQAPKYLIKSIRFYFIAFFIFGMTLLLFVDLTLYSEGQKIQETVQQQSKVEAKQELEIAYSHSLKVLQKEARELAEWDEVHQQFHNPIYYFFWRDERLKDSDFFKSYYDGLELYDANKRLLMPASSNKRNHFFLPIKITSTEPQILLNKHLESHLNVFQEVRRRGSDEIIGYIGITIDFLPFLISQNTFYQVNKSSIHFNGSGKIDYSDLANHTKFKPVENPVTNYLWQLIQDFIIELIILMIIVGLGLAAAFNITIYKPLKVISNYLQRLKNAPNKTHSIPEETFFLKEFEELKHSIHDYHTNLQQTQTELDKQNQTVWEQARRDVLTNIYNRRAFDEAWSEVINNHHNENIPVTFMLFDCDFFKALNDTYGHEVGDEVIKLTASTIQKNLPIDCPPYRIGGDEFAIILQHRSNEQAFEIADKCLQALELVSFNSLGIKEHLSFSVGMSNTQDNRSNDISNLPRQADMAMYKAKQSLNEKVQCYHRDLEKESMSLVSNNIANTVVEAIHSGTNVQMNFQPIQSLKDGSVYYESLIRITDGEETIYPNDIFNVVDRRRLEVEIDRQVVNQIHQNLKQKLLPKGSGLSVNISAKTLLQPSFSELFKSLKPFLTDYKIVIEITENSLIDHMEYANKVLNNLRNDGFLIALDDFGSGYSSIRYLAHMPVDIIKFDMSMSQAMMGNDKKTQNIIRTTAAMILNSGYELVLEGIETDEMLNLAKDIGASHVQGYLIGKPAPKPKVFTQE